MSNMTNPADSVFLCQRPSDQKLSPVWVKWHARRMRLLLHAPAVRANKALQEALRSFCLFQRALDLQHRLRRTSMSLVQPQSCTRILGSSRTLMRKPFYIIRRRISYAHGREKLIITEDTFHIAVPME